MPAVLGNLKRAAALYAAYKTYQLMFPSKKTDVRGKLAIVTGAANGVGKVTARVLVERGARVVMWDVQEKALEAARAELQADYPGADIRSAVCNLAKPEAIKQAASLLQGQDVDIIINNAGIVSGGQYMEDSSDDRMEISMRVNAIAHWYVVKEFLPSMIRRNSGSIISVVSAAGLIGASGLVDYCSSKFAALGLSEALSLELYERGITGITVGAICPGPINTDLFKGFSYLGNPGGILEPIDVANAILTAIECHVELTVMPGWSKPSVLLTKAVYNFYGSLGIKLGWLAANPMANHDGSGANKIFNAISKI